jgi:hypothetical protein
MRHVGQLLGMSVHSAWGKEEKGPLEGVGVRDIGWQLRRSMTSAELKG